MGNRVWDMGGLKPMNKDSQLSQPGRNLHSIQLDAKTLAKQGMQVYIYILLNWCIYTCYGQNEP